VEHPPIDTKRRDWYIVSVDTLRAWGVVLVLAALVVGGYFGYRAWERHDLERRAASTIRDARTLLSRLQGDDALDDYRSEYQSAMESLNAATSAYNDRRYEDALDLALQSHKLLQGILNASGNPQGGAGQAQFISVQGRVEFRRGEGGEWQDARPRGVLYIGDHVKTGANGSAEIVFSDGNLYTARPDTQLVVFRSRSGHGLPGEQAIRMDYGWVNLNTSKRGIKVSVPEAEARVEGDSEASVSYDAGSKTARFAAIRGGMKVDSASGEHRDVGALEQVIHAAGKLSGPEALPGEPELLTPEDNSDFSLERTAKTVLTWEPVKTAKTYALEVSANRLFVDNLIEARDRKTTEATLGLRGEGSFFWRVAAVTAAGVRGPWSSARGFRVSSFRHDKSGGDGEPPKLELAEIKAYGSIFIVGGKTEPGCTLEINGEPVQVGADGTFTKTIQITKEGWSFIEVRARDAGGNETVVSPRVFVEIL